MFVDPLLVLIVLLLKHGVAQCRVLLPEVAARALKVASSQKPAKVAMLTLRWLNRQQSFCSLRFVLTRRTIAASFWRRNDVVAPLASRSDRSSESAANALLRIPVMADSDSDCQIPQIRTSAAATSKR